MSASSGRQSSVVVAAPAKLTLSLRVTGRRDDGYHFIDAEMVTLDFGDELTITEGGTGLEIVGNDNSGLAVSADSQNLVRRALKLVQREAHVRVTKNIAAGAGLGGGSADAAAILRWAGFDDVVSATRLGADVAFCLVGGRARVQGIGELIKPLPYQRKVLTLLTPPFGCPTPAVYAAWDEMGGPTGENGNDLEPAALKVQPELARWRDELGEATNQMPRLAGSGSTWFVSGPHPGPGRRVTLTTPA